MNDKPKSKWGWRLLRWGLVGLALLITLAAMTITEENWRGKRAWENYRRQAAARGESLDWSVYVTNRVPEDQNFARAPNFSGLNGSEGDGQNGTITPNATAPDQRLQMSPNRAGEDYPDAENGGWTRARLTRLEVWQQYYRNPKTKVADDFPLAPQAQSPAADVLLALSKYDAAIEELRTASRRPFSQFGITNLTGSSNMSQMLVYLAALKRSTQVLRLRATAELADTQTAPALEDVQLLLRLDDALRQEPVLIAHLVSAALNALTIQPLYEGLAQHRWNDAQLAELENALATKDFLADFQKAMRGERAFALESLENMRLTREYQTVVDTGPGQSKMVTVGLHLTPSAFFYQNELTFARLYEQSCLPLVDLDKRMVSPSALRRAMTTVQGELKHYNPYKIMAAMLYPAVGNSVKKFAKAQSRTDLAQVACALERYRLAHGVYPATLAPLAPSFIATLPHDVINGQPLHYRRTDDGLFVLYSVGWNETDDGGQIVLAKDGHLVDPDKGDWVWRYPSE